ncbi:ABC transporter substrate-binding protein [Paenibacillus humicola]|uniref:ABC transporter substrate-binding protein n=1 Tax=Paenibacillus humicola TaxID=3110540 RepID=UPI00237B81DE|nr:ABC transporter substrate-binding protein [Paenibacillus humicola]
MRTKRLQAALAAVVVGAMFTMAGCSGGGSGNTGASGSSSAASAPSSAPAETSGAPAGGKVLNIGINADPPSLDPYASSALVDRYVQNSIFDKLFDLDKDGKIVPMLAESYEISPDGKTYTLKLKQGVKFQDGTDFNADAVKFNLDRYEEDNSRRKNELKFVDSVTAVDANTVKIQLSQPFSPFLSILTDRAGMMASPSAVKKYGDDFVNHPVGTGPYAFVEHVSGDHVTLKKNDAYWNGAPKLDEINYKVFTDGPAMVQNLRSGQIDIASDLNGAIKLIPSIKDDTANFTIISESGMGFQGIHLNVTKGPFTNKYLREAVDRAIDRDAFVKVLFDGYASPGNSPFSPGSLAYGDSDKYAKPDPDAIKALLAKGGKPNGFSFKFQVGTGTAAQQFGAVLQNMLKPYNITVELEQVEFGQMLENGTNGNFEALQIGWSGRPDPDQNFYDFVVTKGSQNYSHYANPEVDKLATEARQEQDPTKRKAYYNKAMDILHDDVEYSYIYHQNNIFGFSKKVTGFTYVPDGIIRTAGLDKQ